MLNKFKVGIIQSLISNTKNQTLKDIGDQIYKAVVQGSQVLILGECFNGYYQKQYLQANAEDFSDSNQRDTYNFLQAMSKQYGILLVGGSIPELRNEKLYNTTLCFNKGELIGKYSKTHLFDVDIPGKITYFESQTFTQGNDICVINSEYGKIGIGICYDIRFPEYAQILRTQGCKFLIYPGAFNQTTGPLHWELLMRARAVDNQVYLAGVSTARYRGEDKTIYQAWGHSTLVSPVGEILATTDQDPAILIHEIDYDLVDQIREQIPVSKQRRNDIYELKSLL